MNLDYDILINSKLFGGLRPKELDTVLNCLKPINKSYQKDEFIIRQGDPIPGLAFILEGCAFVIKEEYDGKRLILLEILPGETFSESLACLPHIRSEVSVIANTSCRIMNLSMNNLITTCQSACPFHTRIIQNLLMIVASKNLELTTKVDFLSKRTIRERLLTYFYCESDRKRSNKFEIPYNRQELAEYLSVDRSALSKEISKLVKEGIISTSGKNFELLKSDQ